MASGMIMPQAMTPTQKGRARLPRSSSIAEYLDVFEV